MTAMLSTMSSRSTTRHGRTSVRSGSRLRAGVVSVAVLTLACGGCASGDEQPEAQRPTVASSSLSELPSPPAIEESPAVEESPTAEEPLPCVAGAQPFAGPAAEEYGAERVMAAYCMLAALVEQQTGTSLALPIPEQRTRDLARLEEVLTPRARQDWDRQLRARAAGEPRATERVNGLTLHDVVEVPQGYRRADDLPHVFGTRVGPARAGLVRGGGSLRLSFAVDTNLVLEKLGDDSGRHSLLPVTREASYVLVADGDRWSIDDWQADFRHGPVGLVGAG